MLPEVFLVVISVVLTIINKIYKSTNYECIKITSGHFLQRVHNILPRVAICQYCKTNTLIFYNLQCNPRSNFEDDTL